MREQRKRALLPKLRFPEFREAGEWESKPLAQVCNILQGYGFPEVLQGKSEGKYPFCKVSDISRAVAENGGLLVEATNYIGGDALLKLRAKPIPKGATVFAKIGEALRLNRRAYVQTECLIDNNATGLKAIDGVADDYFVYLLSQLIDLNKHCGGAVPSVNKSTLEEIEVVAPGPDEQKRIADCFSSIDVLITAEAQKLDTLKAYKKGLMQQLFPAEGETLPTLRFPEFLDTGEWEEKLLGSFIEEFREKSAVQDEFEVLTSARCGLVRQREYYDNDRITERDNIGFNIIPPNYLTYRSRSDDRRFYFNENNLSITGIISTYYPVFRVLDGSNKFFVELLARYSTIVGKYSVGTSQTVLSLNELRRIKLPLPKKTEQQKIANCLTSIDELITAQTQKLAALKAHKKGLMQQLFPSVGGVDGEAGRGGRPVVDEAQG
ncbi:restriction endonuclease subunit S [Nitrosomonas sp. sh817]|uniref:restriction endonuclease subunit S n=1 Tax=Nitrosomonas sp. sh817 TaxID=3070658 RepID=UPI0027DB94DE|nr:restriction endonuclease subunit S [Nitrosomonas sp. sh817]WMJ09142.1 restriction endonuclease subunit S [Nitrosomonas sp. sh817]